MKKKVRSKYALECLDCGEAYKASDEFIHCPLCDGIGELSVANYEDNGWGSDSDFQEDIRDFSDMDSLAFDPNIYND